MYARILSLIVFRLILVCLVLFYQLLGLLANYDPLPFNPILFTVVTLSALSGLYVLYLKHRWTPDTTSNFVFIQFIIDILAISFLVTVSGGVDSQFRFAYLISIVLSALFMEKLTIYVVTTLSLAVYFLSLNLVHYPLFNEGGLGELWAISEQINRATLAQFVVCFLTALISGFMQGTYRSGRKTLLEQDMRIRTLRRMHQMMIETLPSGLITCIKDGQIIFINAMGRKLLQLQDKDHTGLCAWSLLDFQPGPLIEKPSTSYLARLEQKVSVEGVRKIMGISYSPMVLESGQEAYLIIFQDLTKVKILEARKLMDDRMAAIGKMAAGVAHEIRNPLAAISGSVQVLRELVPPDDADAEELAQIVSRESNRLNNIISEFLAYARPSPPTDLKPIILEECVTHFIRLTQNDAELKTLPIIAEVDTTPAIILGDEAQLMQVFWNLFRNSFHACSEKGEVKVSVFFRDEDIVLRFVDNGIGMSEAQLKDLFTPFQSFSRSGTGLGMNIVYDIIQIHHGRISVRSKPGQGTTVEMVFANYKE